MAHGRGMLPTSSGQRSEVLFHTLQCTGRLPRQKMTRLHYSSAEVEQPRSKLTRFLPVCESSGQTCCRDGGTQLDPVGLSVWPGRTAAPWQAGCTGAPGSVCSAGFRVVLHRSESPEPFGVPLRAPMCQAPHPTLRSRGYTEKAGLSF